MTEALADEAALIDDYVRELGSHLRGPRRLRHDLLAEVRAGLVDAADAGARGGADRRTAVREAIEEFGLAEELAPLFQAEVVATQGRRTAVVVVAGFPGLRLGWDLLWASGVQWSGPTSPLVPVVARLQDAFSLVVGAAAVVALLALARRAHRQTDPRPMARAVAVLGIGASAVCACLSTTMVLLTSGVVVHQTFAPPALGASALVLALVTRSAVRSLSLAGGDGASANRAGRAVPVEAP